MRLYTVSLQEILRNHRAPHVIDYLSLDAEGAEDFLMNHFPFDKYRIKIMTVERPNLSFMKL